MASRVVLNRRNVLASLAAVGLSAAFGVSFFDRIKFFDFESGHDDSILLGGRFPLIKGVDIMGHYPYQMFTKNFNFRWDLKKNTFAEVATLTAAHTTEPHPYDRSIVSCVSRRSDRLSLFDWALKKETASFVAPKGHYFYGHTSFSDDGTYMVVSATNRSQGLFYVFDYPTLTLRGTLSTGNKLPHELASIGGGRFVGGVYSPNSAEACFGIVNIEQNSFETFSKIVGSFTQGFAVNHAKLHGRTLLALGNTSESEISNLGKGALMTFDVDSHDIQTEFNLGEFGIESEILSVDYDSETGFVWMSVPNSLDVIIWDLAGDRLVSVLKFDSLPRSVTLVKSVDAVVVGTLDRLIAYDRRSLRPLEKYEKRWRPELVGDLTAHTRLA